MELDIEFDIVSVIGEEPLFSDGQNQHCTKIYITCIKVSIHPVDLQCFPHDREDKLLDGSDLIVREQHRCIITFLNKMDIILKQIFYSAATLTKATQQFFSQIDQYSTVQKK